MRSRLRSPRTRRRFIGAALTLALVVGIVGVVVLLPEAHPEKEVIRNVPADKPPPTPRSVRASPELRRQLMAETTAFVRTAVLRRDLDRSWPLVHPYLRQGLTRAQWRTGAIPVVPFPAVGIVEWHVDRSYADDVAVDVVLQPTEKSGLYRKSFTIEFKRVGPPKDGRWLVYAWVPNGVSDALVQDQHQEEVEAALAKVKGHNGLPVAWVLVPIGFIVGVFMLPLVLVLVERRRLRRAEAAHRAALAERYSSSSRPS